jgi:hypothetical protein
LLILRHAGVVEDTMHLSPSVLRRLLDEPGGVGDRDRSHAARCPRCLDALAAMHGADADADRTAPELTRGPVPRRRLRAAWRHPAAAACAVGSLVVGAGTAAATDWLPIFRTEELAPVRWSAADLIGLPDLRAFGDVEVTGLGDGHDVADAAAAAAATGLDVPEVTVLPRGVSGDPEHHVVGEVTATFTFSTEPATAAATELGATLPPPPAGLDGSSVRLEAGPGWAATWAPAGRPTLVVARAVAPTASSSGVELDAARDYLLSLPGVPADVAAQLRPFGADGATLPLVVPTDRVTTSSADVHGVPATVLATRDRTMAAVVWVDGGAVTVVAGALDVDEVLSVARGLR